MDFSLKKNIEASSTPTSPSASAPKESAQAAEHAEHVALISTDQKVGRFQVCPSVIPDKQLRRH